MENLQFNNIKDFIVFRVINRKSNEDLLKDIPYVAYLDLAIIFYYILPETSMGEKKAIQIKNEDIDAWNISVDELMSAASLNTPRLLGLKIQGILTTIAECLHDNALMEMADEEDRNMPLYVATNKSSCNGASVILYKDLLSALSAKLKSDLYVIPCSVHEVILLKAISDCQVDTDSLKELIAHVNKSNVPEGEVLSDSLYYYSRQTNVLSYA